MKHLVPMLVCRDMSETIDFYTQVLGFELESTMGEPATWCSLVHGAVRLMFTCDPPHEHARGEEHEHPEPRLTGVLYVYSEDVEGLYERIAARMEVSEPLRLYPHGMREFAVLDPSGYRLRFGEPV